MKQLGHGSSAQESEINREQDVDVLSWQVPENKIEGEQSHGSVQREFVGVFSRKGINLLLETTVEGKYAINVQGGIPDLS